MTVFPPVPVEVTAESFLKLLHIYCPYVTEELWSKLGNKKFISLEKWPKYDETKIDKKLEEEEKQLQEMEQNFAKNIEEISKISGAAIEGDQGLVHLYDDLKILTEQYNKKKESLIKTGNILDEKY